MKKLFLIFSLLLSTAALQAQYTWCVKLNGKTLLKTVSENQEKNVVSLTDASLKSTGYFEIDFSRSDTSMHRTILVNDASGSGLSSWEEVKRKWRISNKELSKLFEGHEQLKFYYTEIPRDVNKAMLVRVRPVHLCTINRK